MKLTVGPLPPAVYWRRRALVLGGLLLVVLLLVYTCGGSGKTKVTASGSPTGTPKASGAPPLVTPTPSDGPAGTAVPTAPAPTGPTAGTQASAGKPEPSGPCSDEDIQLIVEVNPTTTTSAAGARITLRIKNASPRTCTRDVGAGPQELLILQGQAVIWSSDHCKPDKDSDVRAFGPGVEVSFGPITWDGKGSGPNCTRQPVAAGTYQVMARLDTRWSPRVELKLT